MLGTVYDKLWKHGSYKNAPRKIAARRVYWRASMAWADVFKGLILRFLEVGSARGRLRAHRYGPCEAESLKGRMKRAVALLGEKEVQSIMEREGKIEVSGPPVASFMCCNR